jgi:hypothetical protein
LNDCGTTRQKWKTGKTSQVKKKWMIPKAFLSFQHVLDPITLEEKTAGNKDYEGSFLVVVIPLWHSTMLSILSVSKFDGSTSIMISMKLPAIAHFPL